MWTISESHYSLKRHLFCYLTLQTRKVCDWSSCLCLRGGHRQTCILTCPQGDLSWSNRHKVFVCRETTCVGCTWTEEPLTLGSEDYCDNIMICGRRCCCWFFSNTYFDTYIFLHFWYQKPNIKSHSRRHQPLSNYTKSVCLFCVFSQLTDSWSTKYLMQRLVESSVWLQESYHFLCNPEELRGVTDHVPEAVVQTHIRPDPRWELSSGIRAFKPVGEVTLFCG